MHRIPQDYHLHSHFSIDASQSMRAVCQQAIDLGIAEIAITEHADYIRADVSNNYYDPDGYFAELEFCRAYFNDRLTIRAGVEIGEPHRFPEETDALLDNYPYDFVIGSLHWVGTEFIVSNEYFEGKGVEEAYHAYFEELLRMVKTARFDVVGHLDVGKRHGYDVHGFYDVSPYEEEIREIYRVLIERGKGIEINHGSLSLYCEVNEPAPNFQALRWYREMGGDVLTLGSDGHQPNGVGLCLDQAVTMAKAAGFTSITGFRGRRTYPIPLDG